MQKVAEMFVQTPHPNQVSDFYHVFNQSNICSVVYWWSFFQQIEDIEGDIVECGVGRGRSLITLSTINTLIARLSNKPERYIYALDSFEGFPEPTEFDKSKRSPKKGEWRDSPKKEFEYSPQAITHLLNLAGVNAEIKFVKGFFDKTTANFDSEKIAILHLDGDLYRSVKDPLFNLWRKVSVGGLIIIDDFLYEDHPSESFPGARKAVMEFLDDNNSFEYLKSMRGTPYLKRIF